MELSRQIMLVHATGNANVRQALLALEEADMLESFQTTIAYVQDSAWGKLLPGSARAELNRRSYEGVPYEKIRPHPLREMLRLLAQKLPPSLGMKLSVDGVYEDLDKAAAKALSRNANVQGVYAYEDGAETVFRAAKAKGVSCIYDLPIGYWRYYHRLLAEERDLQPEWSSTLDGMHDSAEKLERKDAELALADTILVASSFTALTLGDYPGKINVPVHRISYGTPPVGAPRDATSKEAPLRILYVGSISQRKGISYLIEGARRLQVPYKLTLLGRPVARPPVMQAALSEHNWILSAPPARVLEIMREHDVLVLPSLFEGFGLVITEAMSQGTVVVATPHTAAVDLVMDGVDGFVVPIRSADAIAAALTKVAEDRDLLLSMSRAAQAKAASVTWESYRAQVVQAVVGLLG